MKDFHYYLCRRLGGGMEISMCDVAERLEKMGMEKGMEQGVKQGRKLGRNEGIHEEKIRVYKKLLEKGFSKQEAQEITELPQFLEN